MCLPGLVSSNTRVDVQPPAWRRAAAVRAILLLLAAAGSDFVMSDCPVFPRFTDSDRPPRQGRSARACPAVPKG